MWLCLTLTISYFFCFFLCSGACIVSSLRFTEWFAYFILYIMLFLLYLSLGGRPDDLILGCNGQSRVYNPLFLSSNAKTIVVFFGLWVTELWHYPQLLGYVPGNHCWASSYSYKVNQFETAPMHHQQRLVTNCWI